MTSEPCGPPIGSGPRGRSPRIGWMNVLGLRDAVGEMYEEFRKFLHCVVVSGRVRLLVYADHGYLRTRFYRWPRPEFGPPSPSLQCDPSRTVDVSGVVSDPALIDREFREAWLPYFCRSV